MGNKSSVEFTEQLQLRLKNILAEYFGKEVVYDKVYEFPEIKQIVFRIANMLYIFTIRNNKKVYFNREVQVFFDESNPEDMMTFDISGEKNIILDYQESRKSKLYKFKPNTVFTNGLTDSISKLLYNF